MTVAEIREDYENDLVALDNSLHALTVVTEAICDDLHNMTPQKAAALEHVAAGVRAAAERLNRYACALPPRKDLDKAE